MITHVGQKFRTISGDIMTVTYFPDSWMKRGYGIYGDVNGRRYDYTTDGKCFAVLGRNNDQYQPDYEITKETHPEEFLWKN